MRKFREKNSYLVKKKFDGHLSAITVEIVTKKGYQIFWHSGGTSWELKNNFDSEYELIENISTKVKDIKLAPPPPPIPSESKAKTTMITCPICHGMGTVYDQNSTAGTKPCPLCQGNKMIVKDVEFTR